MFRDFCADQALQRENLGMFARIHGICARESWDIPYFYAPHVILRLGSTVNLGHRMIRE